MSFEKICLMNGKNERSLFTPNICSDNNEEKNDEHYENVCIKASIIEIK